MATLENGGAAKCRPTTSTAHVPRTAHHQRAERLARRFTVIVAYPTRVARKRGVKQRGPHVKTSERVGRSAQLLGERGREPLSVTLGIPPSVSDEEVIDLRRHQRVDQVGCVALSQAGLEGAGASECAGDLTLTSIALLSEFVEKLGGRGIGSRRARENLIHVVGSLIDRRRHLGESAEELVGFAFVEQRCDVLALEHRKRLVVTGDGCVEEGGEDPELRGEKPVHGRYRHVGAITDRFHGGGHVAAFDEHCSARIDHCSTGEAYASVTAGASL